MLQGGSEYTGQSAHVMELAAGTLVNFGRSQEKLFSYTKENCFELLLISCTNPLKS